MALTLSTDKVDETNKELLTYGTPDFPVAFFDDDLTKVRVPWHWHDEFELCLLLKGAVQMYMGGESFTLNAGEGYFSNSGILHSANLLSDTGRQHVIVFNKNIISKGGDIFDKKYIEPIISDKTLTFIKLSPAYPWQKEILKLIGDAWLSGACENEDYALTVRNNLSLILSIIERHVSHDASKIHEFTQRQRSEIRAKRVLSFIEQHYAEPVTIDDIAESANMSVSTCLRLFHDVLHTTPIKYLINYRLRQIAKGLEANDGQAISDIVYAGGFMDISYFNRCFKKEYGMTPTQYIKSRRDEIDK